jgi:hypothetical protein
MFVIEDQTHRAAADLRRELVACIAHSGSTFSGVGASGKPGAVQAELVRLVVNPQGVPPDIGEIRLDVEFRFPRDYWLYCLTNSVQPRLFVDFNADSCVIIRDRAAFRQRLAEAAKAPTSSAPMREGAAVYLDPLLSETANVFVPLAKPFGYSYQDEYRFAWIPPAGTPALTHLDIELGSLADIAELVVV